MADDPFSGDPFSDPDDPARAERERRRREREERRRARREGSGKPPPQGPPRDAAPPPEPPREQPPLEPEQSRLPPEPPVERSQNRPPPEPPPEPPRPQQHRPRQGETGGWKEEALARAARRRESGPSGGTARKLIAAALLLVTLGLGWLFLVVAQPFHGEGEGRITLEIPEGSSVGEIGEMLEERDVIASSTFFQLRVTLAGKRAEMYPGSYTLAEGMSYGDAIDALSTVPVERTVTLTIPEGLSRREVAPVVAEAGLSGDYLRQTRASERFDPARYGAPRGASLEGFLFPATYELPAEAGAGALVNSQLQAFQDRISGIGMRYARSKNLTVYDVLTIASMVEREVSVPRERPLVASVIYNRLSEGIPLGIDATTRYAVGNFEEPLTQSELDSDSPFNTRNSQGLPPGPIGNPGEESIRAAARPADSDYLYYVVEPGTCGVHSFSETFAEFQRDAAEYDRAREEAGGQSPTDCP